MNLYIIYKIILKNENNNLIFNPNYNIINIIKKIEFYLLNKINNNNR